MTLKELKKQFMAQYIMASQLTKEKYEKDIDIFFNVCKIKTLEELNNFNENNITNFYNYSNDNNWSANTTNQRLQTAKLFTSWCFKKHYIENNFLEDIKRIRTNNQVHYTPSNDDCDKLLQYIKNHTKKRRLYLMIKLLLNSGLRRSEICNLKIEDIDKENFSLRILGKGNKYIDQPINPNLMIEIIEYINTERKDIIESYKNIGGKDKGFVFLSGIGENVNKNKKDLTNGNKINDIAFFQQIKRYAKLAGIENAEKFNCHCFRRNFVTSIYEETGDILVAQKAARHSNSSTTTQCYINFDKEKVRDAVNNIYKEDENKYKLPIQNTFSQDDEYQLYLLLQKKYSQNNIKII